MKKIKKWIKKIINNIFDLFFPEKCIKCKKEEEIICVNCINTLRLSHENPSNDIFSVFSYKDIYIKKLLINLKYFNKKSFGIKLGEILYEKLLEEISEIKNIEGNKIILIPIPVTKKRINERGYNQSLIIAKGIYEASLDKEDIFEFRCDLLIKSKDTERQAKIKDRSKRLVNLKDSFVCTNKEFVKGRTIILVDDITTTGATLKEAMSTLKKAKSKKVFGFVFAH